MGFVSLFDLRKEAERHLKQYRRNKKNGSSDPWVEAVEEARAYFKYHYPLKERFMTLRWGLDAPIPSHKDMRQLNSRLSIALDISQSTAYKWREDIVEITLYAAMHRQIISLMKK